MYLSIKEIKVTELAERMDGNTPRIIDVREIREFSGGTVPGAEAMPMASVPARMNELIRDEELVVICRSGARSAQVCMFLQQQGYENVYNLRGGMMAWASSGQQLAANS
jgi:rhodanese-related sulfurtransferase